MVDSERVDVMADSDPSQYSTYEVVSWCSLFGVHLCSPMIWTQ